MDYPGFGLSEGLHCFIPSFDGLVDDVIEHYSKIKGTYTPMNSQVMKFSVIMKFFNCLLRPGGL